MSFKEYELEEVLDFFNGKKRPKTEGNIPVFGGNGIVAYCDNYNTESGNIIVGRVGAYCGNVNLYKNKCWISDNAILVKVKKGFDIDFMYYLLINENLYNLRIGSSQPLITQSSLKTVKVKIPMYEEQKAIAKILSDLDEKIEINNKINKNLEEMAQAIFKQWFVDFEFPNEEGKPYKSSGGEMVESEFGMIPKDFKVISVYDVANIIYGAPFKSKLFNEDKKGLPLIRIRDLKSGTPNFYTEEEHSKATIVKTGDILVGMDAEFTPTIWHGETGYLNQRVCMFKSKISYISDYFLYESIKPYMKFMESAKVGTTVIHLGKSDIDKLTIILPSIDIIKRFSEISNSILVKMINIYNENRNLNKLRDTLLPKLMSGEIRVPLENSEN
ncbi:restriction endonuclease subunit S [Clostridium perfringens]|uniref:restriction endonuclease subunit S n=1 Tax=Clostridium perfringens TaxID=1502 RepID=UPI0039E9192E